MACRQVCSIVDVVESYTCTTIEPRNFDPKDQLRAIGNFAIGTGEAISNALPAVFMGPIAATGLVPKVSLGRFEYTDPKFGENAEMALNVSAMFVGVGVTAPSRMGGVANTADKFSYDPRRLDGSDGS